MEPETESIGRGLELSSGIKLNSARTAIASVSVHPVREKAVPAVVMKATSGHSMGQDHEQPGPFHGPTIRMRRTTANRDRSPVVERP